MVSGPPAATGQPVLVASARPVATMAAPLPSSAVALDGSCLPSWAPVRLLDQVSAAMACFVAVAALACHAC